MATGLPHAQLIEASAAPPCPNFPFFGSSGQTQALSRSFLNAAADIFRSWRPPGCVLSAKSPSPWSTCEFLPSCSYDRLRRLSFHSDRLSVCTRFFRKTDTALSRSFQKPKSPILKRTRRWQWLKKCLLRRKLSNGSDYFPHR